MKFGMKILHPWRFQFFLFSDKIETLNFNFDGGFDGLARAQLRNVVRRRLGKCWFSSDSSIKRNNAVIKKLKQITEEQREGLVDELRGANLSKFASEAVSSICEARLKSSDIQAAVQIVEQLKTAREAVIFGFTGTTIGAVSTAAVSWKYSKSPNVKILKATDIKAKSASIIENKKKLKLKELRKKKKGWKKNASAGMSEEVELLLGLIGVVSRVLRMVRITRNRVLWCKDKIRKLDVLEGKLQRDPCPILFPC